MKISKLDAAKRQLDGAIQLWFSDGDPVAVHALACAAHQIIQDVGEAKGQRAYHLEEIMKSIVKPERVKEAVDFLRKPMMFIKHADRDMNEVLEFSPGLTPLFIMLSICGLTEIGEGTSDIQRIFGFWHTIHDTGLMKKDALKPFEQKLGARGIEHIRAIDKKEFFKQSLLLHAQNRAQ